MSYDKIITEITEEEKKNIAEFLTDISGQEKTVEDACAFCMLCTECECCGTINDGAIINELYNEFIDEDEIEEDLISAFEEYCSENYYYDSTYYSLKDDSLDEYLGSIGPVSAFGQGLGNNNFSWQDDYWYLDGYGNIASISTSNAVKKIKSYYSDFFDEFKKQKLEEASKASLINLDEAIDLIRKGSLDMVDKGW